MYIDKLDDDVVKIYNNTYHNTIKMKLVDVKSNTYTDSSKEINDKDPKFKIGDIVRLSKYKNIFAKGYVLNWPEKLYVIKIVKNIKPWTSVISDLKSEEINGTFNEKEFQELNKKSLELKK